MSVLWFTIHMHQEEREHGGHEVGEGHLPGAAVVRAAVALLLHDDDDRDLAVLVHFAAVRPRLWALRLLQAVSISANVGRTSAKIARRAELDGDDGGEALREGDDAGLE